jgi:hypothetical protein
MIYHVHRALVGEIQSLVEEITESTPTQWCTGETSRPPQTPTPAFLTGDFITLEEEVDPKEREFEPKARPEMPPPHFAHGSTGAGYEAGMESWGMPMMTVLEETPCVGYLVSIWGRPEIRFHVTRMMW